MKRRSTHQVDELLMEAAAGLFMERGYRAATTREIAARAGVAEPLLFRRYRNKAGVFVACTVEPVRDRVASFASKWSDPDTADGDFLGFSLALLDFLRQQCRVLLAVSAAITHEREEMEEAGVLNRIDEMVTELINTAEGRVTEGPDREERARVLVSAVWSAALYGDLLVPRSREKSWLRILVAGLETSH